MDIAILLVLITGIMTLLWLFTFVFLIFIIKFTPALPWFMAWFGRRPLFCINYKDGITTWKVGSKRLGNFSKVKRLGYYELEKGTGNLDLKTKIIWYNVLTEHAKTQPLYKAAIIDELKNLGFRVMKWADLRFIINSAVNNTWANEEYKRLKAISIKKAQRFLEVVKNIRKARVNIKYGVSYKLSSLYNLFSNDYNPAGVEEAVVLGVAADRKKRGTDMMAWAFVIFLILLGVGICYTLITGGQGSQEVVVKFTPDMLANASQMIAG